MLTPTVIEVKRQGGFVPELLTVRHLSEGATVEVDKFVLDNADHVRIVRA
jgi:hypothetical protein